MASSKNHWNHRVKWAEIYQYGQEFELRKLRGSEITSLLNLIDTQPSIRALVESNFGGFSRPERRRRLIDRCESDTFVCLKNIFASERFDDIILREFASLDQNSQEIYRLVAAMENSGVHVHRQLVIRVLNIPAMSISAVLGHLADIIDEYEISKRDGVYGWKGRHPVIVDIIASNKFNDLDQIESLFNRVIDNLAPTIEIEIRTIRQLCNFETGLSKIPDKNIQNNLLQRMISIAPGERVPRHRLIRNLMDLEEFEKAETEIRMFEKGLRVDGPVYRYKVNLLLARAIHTKGILNEDRIARLNQAADMAAIGVKRYKDNKYMMRAYCEVGIEHYKLSGKLDVFDDAISALKEAETNIGDPDISRIIEQSERRITGFSGK